MSRQTKLATALLGSTGLVGSFILSELLQLQNIKVSTLGRRCPELQVRAQTSSRDSTSELLSTVSGETEEWPALLEDIFANGRNHPPVTIMFSALSTNLYTAGTFEEWKKIDFDLQLACAKAAKDSDVWTYVLISGNLADKNNKFNEVYRLKGELEEAIKVLGFHRTIIVRPGMIMGDRSKLGQDRPWREQAIVKTFESIRNVFGNGLISNYAQDGEVIARAAVRAALAAGEDFKGDANGVWILGPTEIVALGSKN